ncbi:MAG TPA: molybdopterin-synthase adenylyltransferase MoeB [Kiritimatiellia bacterium]|nr:molybdopterin-synthase adenylyltransferase MoeB [Kiritimatiellia bacterium]
MNSFRELSAQEIARYNRHLILPAVGIDGQRKLTQARVLLIGAGGLGSPIGMYLAAAGIGHMGIVDFDRVDISNIQRQIMHGTKDVGRLKIDSARDRINDINPNVQVATYDARLTSDNALDIIREYDVVVDGTDNFPTRYLVNDACVLLGKPNVYGSIFRFEGQASVFWAKKGACYRCLYPEPPPPGLVPSCAEGGVLGVLPGIIGSIQANETVKLIIGRGEPLINRLVLFDALGMNFRELKLDKDPNCPICGNHPTIKSLVDYEAFCGSPDQTKPAAYHGVEEITAIELKRRIDLGQNIALIDVREPHEHAIASIPNAQLIPLAHILNHPEAFDPKKATVVLCRSGGRSEMAIRLLRNTGYTGQLLNLKGGILAWSDEVDPSVQKY